MGVGKRTASYFQYGKRCPRQGCVTPVCEVHVPNYLLSVQMHDDKVEVYTSVQVHMQEVAGVEQFPIGLLGALAIFLLNALFKDLCQAIV